MVASNWAVILCKFKDDNTATPERRFLERLFTAAGRGSFNAIDFFHDMSHGKLDLGGSQLFGWFTLNSVRGDYAGNIDDADVPEGKYAAHGLVTRCIEAARAGGAPLDRFHGTFIVINGPVGAFGKTGEMIALCDSEHLYPTAVCHEMGHAYGLSHSRYMNSEQDCMDSWDMMSTLDLCYMSTRTEWDIIGPGLNAWNMRSRNWLDESRVWSAPSGTSGAVVQLRPLYRPDLYGNLAVELGPFLIEYRVKEGWDAGFPRSAVFVHDFAGGRSYLMGSGSGFEHTDGESFVSGSPDFPYAHYVRMHVLSIDEANLTANLWVDYRAAQRLQLPEVAVVGTIVGGVKVGAGGGIIVNGTYVPIPPYDGRIAEVIRHLGDYVSGSGLSDSRLRVAAQRSALDAISAAIAERKRQLNPFRVPAPRGDEKLRPPRPPGAKPPIESK